MAALRIDLEHITCMWPHRYVQIDKRMSEEDWKRLADIYFDIDMACLDLASAEARVRLFAYFSDWGMAYRRKAYSYIGGIGPNNDRDPGNWVWGRSLEVMLGEFHYLHPLQHIDYNDETRGDFLEAVLGFETVHRDACPDQMQGLIEFRRCIEMVTVRLELLISINGRKAYGLSRASFMEVYNFQREYVREQVHAREIRNRRRAKTVAVESSSSSSNSSSSSSSTM